MANLVSLLKIKIAESLRRYFLQILSGALKERDLLPQNAVELAEVLTERNFLRLKD